MMRAITLPVWAVDSDTGRRREAHRAIDPSAAGPEIVLDLSHLVSRAHVPVPGGIDRAEMAYARTLSRLIPERLRFSAVHATGLYGRIPAQDVERLLDRIEERWTAGPPHVARTIRLDESWSLRPRPIAPPRRPRIVLQASARHLDQGAIIAHKLAAERARFVCTLRNLTPLLHSEYARARDVTGHFRRMRTIEKHAAGILIDSQATLAALRDSGGHTLRGRPMRVAHPGIDHTDWQPNTTREAGRGYFVCIGAIEPRRNHLMLLHLWRSIVAAVGSSAAPHLMLVGRRGSDNENAIDMLDHCARLNGIVHELPAQSDTDLRALLGGSRALLAPSFVEGFDRSLGEALAAGVPVIASDIPAHREVGVEAPDYIDPLDGAAWRSAILDYHAPSSAGRAAQLARLRLWHPPTWERHIAVVLSLIEEVATC